MLPGATVTVTGLEDATRSTIPQPTTTSAQGIATLPGLRPGRYGIQVEFPGFETANVRDVRLRAGDNKQTMTLTLQKLQDTVTVGRDRQEAAADRQNSFGSALTREQIEALSDDPDVLRQQLIDMSYLGAQRSACGPGGADHPGARCVHERRRADGRRAPFHRGHAGVGSRLRARPALTAHRGADRRRVVDLDAQFELSRHVSVRQSRRLRSGPAEQLHATDRRSHDRVRHGECWGVPQDDIRFGKNLTLSPGLRYELQAHLDDWTNLGPRIGATWAPFMSGKTTVRASAGIFYDWLSQTTYG